MADKAAKLYEVMVDTFGSDPQHVRGDLLTEADTPHDLVWGARVGTVRHAPEYEGRGLVSTTQPVDPQGNVMAVAGMADPVEAAELRLEIAEREHDAANAAVEAAKAALEAVKKRADAREKAQASVQARVAQERKEQTRSQQERDQPVGAAPHARVDPPSTEKP